MLDGRRVRAQLQDHVSLTLLYDRIHASGDAISGPGASDAAAAAHPGTGDPTVVWVQDGRVMASSRD